ncbi:GD14567 [Drosophila simulans]|uniref:GD14567 n=1 Tax=Drosophila simulans TaxID=7240 RepID=B4NVT8_DROSI|nr:GD14567 [Drosophila simulans]
MHLYSEHACTHLNPYSPCSSSTAARLLLRRFLHTTRGDLSAAQRLLELNYGLRNKHAHIFIDRDPLDASSQQLLQVA